MRNKGFTLIELVITVMIIGILAATALPRFANLSNQATIEANRAHAGALRAAVNIAHTAWIAGGAPNSTSFVTLDGNSYRIAATGWPSYQSAVASTTAAKCANTIAALDGLGGGQTPFVKDFPQTIAANGSVGGSCTQAPCACTETICYLASSTSGGICVYTLNGTSYTITYNLNYGKGTVKASP